MSLEAPPVSEYNGRKYRSKKQRPCDLCRSRKIQCKLQGNDPACELCRRLDRRCTFILGPLRRKYRSRAERQQGANGGTDTAMIVDDNEQPQEQSQDAGMVTSITSASAQNARQTLDPAPFDWLPPNQVDADQMLTPRTASNLLTMAWPDVDFPMGPLPDELSGPEMHYNGHHSHSPSGQMLPRRASQVTGASPSTSPHGQDLGHRSSLSRHPADSAEASTEHQNNIEAAGNDAGADWDSNWPAEFSLESAQKGHSNMLVGLSSEFDPFFLRHYLYNVHDTYRMFRLHIRKVVDDDAMPPRDHTTSVIGSPKPCPSGPMPLQFVVVDEEIWKDETKSAEKLFATASTEQSDALLLNELVPTDLGARLIKLYTQFVHPSNPIFCLAELHQMMPESDATSPILVSLRSAIYALAAPFTFLDDELSVSKGYLQVPTDNLWAIAFRGYYRASRQSHLSLLQLCLLLLHMPPQSFVVAEPPSFWALSCSALAIAETLGLNIDPLEWRLPRSEVMLRRRLWWLTYSTHMWQALVCSRPAHINDDNWDVSNLRADDFEIDEHDDPDIRESMKREIPICLAHCELSMILAEVLRDFYSLRAVRESRSLTALLNRAQPLRTRIEGWRQTLPFLSKPASDLTEEEFESGAGLRLAHLTVEILIFRALLRPLLSHAVSPSDGLREPISTIFDNCYTCAKVATEIISSLRAKHFASFWPHYVRYQLCYISAFILMNLAQSTTHDMAVKYKTLLSRWRNTLRIQARAWPLARLAAMRLDAIFWKGLSSVVHGAGSASPAVMLLKDQGSKGSGEG